MKKIVFALLLLIVAFTVSSGFWWPIYLPTPVVSLSESWSFDQISKDETLKKVLNPKHTKRIEWAPSSKVSFEPTETSIVYIHGFSATPQEISPVMEVLSQNLNLNLYFARLTGHGLNPDEMGAITANSLRMDAEEAFQVGKRLSKKNVILVGCSTGAILALDLALRHPEVSAVIAISPNYRPISPFAHFVGGPMGPVWSKLIFGDYRSWTARTPEIAENWMTRYPSKAVSGMMDFLSFMKKQDLSKVKIPVATFYTLNDEVIDIPLAIAKHRSFTHPKSLLVEVPSKDHVLAGKYQSPETTELVIEKIEAFLRSLKTQP